jgi:hypothetical protein
MSVSSLVWISRRDEPFRRHGASGLPPILQSASSGVDVGKYSVELGDCPIRVQISPVRPIIYACISPKGHRLEGLIRVRGKCSGSSVALPMRST